MTKERRSVIAVALRCVLVLAVIFGAARATPEASAADMEEAICWGGDGFSGCSVGSWPWPVACGAVTIYVAGAGCCQGSLPVEEFHYILGCQEGNGKSELVVSCPGGGGCVCDKYGDACVAYGDDLYLE